MLEMMGVMHKQGRHYHYRDGFYSYFIARCCTLSITLNDFARLQAVMHTNLLIRQFCGVFLIVVPIDLCLFIHSIHPESFTVYAYSE